MPVVSSAIAAVTATITSVATVGVAASVGAIASAVATTGTLVGMAGLGVTAIGIATKDKGLLKAGKIMGFVGLGMGVTGWAVGALNSAGAFGAAADSADDLAAGSLDDMVGASDDAIGEMQGMTKDAIREMGGIRNEAIRELGRPLEAMQTGTQVAGASPPLAQPGAPLPTDLSRVTDLPSPSVINNAASMPPATATPAAGPAVPQPGAAPGGPTLQPMSQGSVGTTNTPAPTTVVGGSRLDTGIQPFKAASFNVPPPPAGSGASGIASWWNSLNPNTQAALAISGGQAASGMVTGLYGGYLQGLADDERLEYQRQLDAWRQRNASYAPRVNFHRPGVLGRA